MTLIARMLILIAVLIGLLLWRRRKLRIDVATISFNPVKKEMTAWTVTTRVGNSPPTVSEWSMGSQAAASPDVKET